LDRSKTQVLRIRAVAVAACAVGAAALLIAAMRSAPAPPPTVGGIPGVVAPGAAMELVQEGFGFTEGPVGTADGGLLFSDLRGNRTYYLDIAGKISVVRDPSNGANGLALTKDGELLSAEGPTKRITKRAEDGAITVVTDGRPGTPLLAPNDLIMDSKGAIYFTDPGGAPLPPEPGRPTRVYYLPPSAKTPVVVDTQNPVPNGLTLTNDDKTLIVDDTSSPIVWAFDIEADGTASNRHVFTTLRDIPAGKLSFADGIAIDRDDRIFVATLSGVQVFDAHGEYLGAISVPRQPANVAFSAPGKQTLYITARQGLYRIKTLTMGPDRLGK
jgi:gluconolactonase